MENTSTLSQPATVITSAELLKHWLGHRSLTRRVIEAFPEKEFFEFSIGGMRTFASIVQELLDIGAPGIRQIVLGKTEDLGNHKPSATTKADVLELWDKATEEISQLWGQISDERFHDSILAFGQYEGTVQSSIFYYIDNEIHHRGQGYVYLRSLGIEPPMFWAR